MHTEKGHEVLTVALAGRKKKNMDQSTINIVMQKPNTNSQENIMGACAVAACERAGSYLETNRKNQQR